MSRTTVPPSPIRPGLHPRTIYFPAKLLERVETRPGALVELLTIALTNHLRGEGLLPLGLKTEGGEPCR